MGGWTLEYLESLPAWKYSELVAWIRDGSDRSAHGDDGSIDMDARSNAQPDGHD